MIIGLIREEKIPSDTRVAFTPNQIKQLLTLYPTIRVLVQPSSTRCFPDTDFIEAGATVQEDLSECDVLFGVKEVPIQSLLPGKTYFFFSHTIKKQAYNKKLLKAILDKHIRLIDYECITNENGVRLVAFGRWAGIVGAYNALRLWNKRTNSKSDRKYTELIPAHKLTDFSALKYYVLNETALAPAVYGVSGDGRVAKGVWELFDSIGIQELSIDQLSTFRKTNKPVYVKLSTEKLYLHKETKHISLPDFFKNPHLYESTFSSFYPYLDVFVNAVYWDPKAPVFFSWEEMSQSNFAIKAIADITCDIEGSVPCTVKATTIAEPFMGIDVLTKSETAPFSEHSLDMMTIDNLPNELPRNASEEFGYALLTYIIPDLLGNQTICQRATIANNGYVTPNYAYLENWVNS